MIPAEIDVQAIIRDLNRVGWKDQKIEIALGLSKGYVAKLKEGPRPNRPYQLAARLFNFWEQEVGQTTT